MLVSDEGNTKIVLLWTINQNLRLCTSRGSRLIPFFHVVSLLKRSLEDLPMSLNMTEAELFLP